MISRRTILAGGGAAILGLLSRIRFAPSPPRRRRIVGRLSYIRIMGSDGVNIRANPAGATLSLANGWQVNLTEVSPGQFELDRDEFPWASDVMAFVRIREANGSFTVTSAYAGTLEQLATRRPPWISWGDGPRLYCGAPERQNLIRVYSV